ncbi:alpha/beta hydrolase [Spirillospora sp. CA-294931]|uniref:alpha/beta hydrolase n=1 Tax=Spirillospora sp. CA-294931 TaxID=3240042 RepID=UPI003D8B63C0
MAASLIDHYRASNRAATAYPPLTLEQARDVDERWGDITAEPGGVDYLETDAGGVPALWAEPHGCARDRVLLCLHGGGFIGGSMYTHRKMFGHLAKAAGVRALIPHYRRTPEHRHPAPVDDATTAYAWLLDQGIEPGAIAVTGDSAGGGLTVTTMLSARDRGLPLAAALLPFSPWVDLEFTGETIVSRRGTDVLFGGDTPMNLTALVEMFLGDGDRRDPLVSPIHADLTGLPPMYIQVSEDEMLLDDARRLDEHARKHGVEVRLDEFPGQQHTFQMSAGRSPVADDAIARMAAWVRPRLGL